MKLFELKIRYVMLYIILPLLIGYFIAFLGYYIYHQIDMFFTMREMDCMVTANSTGVWNC